MQPPLLNLSLQAAVTESESCAASPLQGPHCRRCEEDLSEQREAFTPAVPFCLSVYPLLSHSARSLSLCLSPSQSTSLFSFISLSFSHSLPLCLSPSKIISLSSFKPFSLYLLQSASHCQNQPRSPTLSPSVWNTAASLFALIFTPCLFLCFLFPPSSSLT